MIARAVLSAMRSRRGRLACLLVLSAIAAASCARQPLPPDAGNVPGFLLGLVHGFIIVFSFVGSLFSDIRIYAFPNSGGWYDFGFLLGAMAFLGGGGASSSARPQP